MIGPEFYPTPSTIAHRMLAKISDKASNFLEPNAGRGDLAEAIKRHGDYSYGSGSRNKVDCIESDPDLVSILKDKDFPIVGYDWLDYSGVSYYDAIVMNPPFSNGDDHLLKAWDFLYDGEIVCLLNSETLRNPHTKARQRLAQIIKEHGETEELGACFDSAARKTSVEVVMVYLKKTANDDRVDLWANTSDEKTVDTGELGNDPAMLAIRDNLGNMEHYYNMANEHMTKAFQHLRKASIFMGANDISDSDYKTIVGIALDNVNSARAEFGRKHRKDSWMHVFDKMEFHRWLDKKQRDQFLRDVQADANIPFTAENIKGTLQNVFEQKQRLFEQSVSNVFDELTSYFKDNTSHVEGWKTNDSYKVNLKLVFPWGCSFSYGSFNLYSGSGGAVDVYADLDRLLAVLDGRSIDEIYTVGAALQNEFRRLGYSCVGPFEAIESTYFHIRFYKKGTVHLKWKRKDLWEKFNVTASKGKRWLGSNTQEGPQPPEWAEPVPTTKKAASRPRTKSNSDIMQSILDAVTEARGSKTTEPITVATMPDDMQLDEALLLNAANGHEEVAGALRLF